LFQVEAEEEMKYTDKKDTAKKDTDKKDTDKKDTDKKKQTTSPFQMWAKEHRAQVKEEMGGKLTAQELVKEMALRWKALDKQSKLSYKVREGCELACLEFRIREVNSNLGN